MVARITKLILLLQILAAAGIFILGTLVLEDAATWQLLSLSLACVLVVRMLITANNFVLTARHRSQLPDHCHVGPLGFCRLFLTEFRATMISSSWTMPFHSFARRAGKGDTLPVLLVHGYGCNSGYWHSMSKALSKAGITHHAVNLEPVVGSIDDYVPHLHGAIEALCGETGCAQIIIVAHSMGGLATRAYLRDHGSHRVARVITLGTPHRGTVLAHFGVGVNTRQMCWTAAQQEGTPSPWLQALASSENPEVYRLFVSIYSHHDNIVSPQTSAHLCGAKNIALHGIGHVALGLDRTVQALVVREIQAVSCAIGRSRASGLCTA